MDYTPKHYEQDKRIAQHICKKHFKGHPLREDLIQVAICELWKLRTRRQKNHLEYDIALACHTAHKKMISLLRKETRHLTDSLDRFVGEDVGLRLSDIIPIEQPTPHDYCDVQEIVKNLLPLKLTLTEQKRQIISLYLKHYTQTEIAKRIGTSLQYVNNVVIKFRRLAREILDGGDL